MRGGTFKAVDSVDSVDSVGSVDAVGASLESLLIVSSASLSRLVVAFWKISSSLLMVGKTLERSSSLVLLTMSTRLILIASLRGESMSRLIIDCLVRAGMFLLD